jgi:hypothetical protein
LTPTKKPLKPTRVTTTRRPKTTKLPQVVYLV